MDNYSDINLKGGSKIKVGDSLTISDSGVLGSDNNPKYLEVEYQFGNAVIEESKICVASDFSVIGKADFASSVDFKSFPKVDMSNPMPTEDNQLASKKYVDSKASSGGSSKAVEYETKNSIGTNIYHYDIGGNSFEANVIAAVGFCIRCSDSDVNAYILGKNENGFFFNDAGSKHISLEFTSNDSEKIALESYVDAAIANAGSASVPSEIDVTSVKISNASNKNKYTELEYVSGNFALTNECGTKYNLPWENSGASRTLVTDYSLGTIIGNGIYTDYVCTDDIRFQNTCGDNYGQIFASCDGVEIVGGAKLCLNGGGGNVNLCASCGNVVMHYKNGGSIITPSNLHGSTSTNPNVFVTSCIPGSSGCGLHMVVVTQAEYNQMSSHDMTTLYFISGC